MANQKKQEETRTSIDNLNDNLASLGEKVQNNSKKFMLIAVAVIVVVGLILMYIFAFYQPAAKKAMVEAGKGDVEYILKNQERNQMGIFADSLTLAQSDSIALAHYKAAAAKGHEGGNRARLMIAEIEYKNGNYQEAINYLDKYKAKDNIIGAAAYSLKGDCYVNLDQLDKAVGAYKDAIKQSDKNPYYTPFFMLKLGRVYKALGKNDEALKLYEEIEKNYPQYFEGSYDTLDQELEMARNNAAK